VWDLGELHTRHSTQIRFVKPTVNLTNAGMAEGGVCVWDLEELPVRHPIEIISPTTSRDTQQQDQKQQGESVVARRPSYSTEGVGGGGGDGGGGTGAGPIVDVATVAKEGGGRNAPCTVVALTEWGEVRVCVCVGVLLVVCKCVCVCCLCEWVC
jgi:hypothetical protein